MKTKQIFTTLIIFLINSIYVNAQWVQTNGPLGGCINGIIRKDTLLYAGTEQGLYYSTNDGGSWSSTGNFNCPIQILCSVNYGIWLGNYYGFYLSTDNGNTWLQKNNSLIQFGVKAIYADSNLVLVADPSGLYKSTDKGDTWILLTNGLPSSIDISKIIKYNGTIYAGSYWDFCYSIDNGDNWIYYSYPQLLSLAGSANLLYKGNYNGVYSSINNGLSWNLSGSFGYVFSLAAKDSVIYAGTQHGVYKKINNKSVWFNVNNGLTPTTYQSFLLDSSDTYAGSWGGGIFKSTNNGSFWKTANDGIVETFLREILVKDDSIFAATSGGGIYVSGDGGGSWLLRNNGLTGYDIFSLAQKDSILFIASADMGIFKSNDNGLHWTISNNGMSNHFAHCLKTINNKIFAGLGTDNYTIGGGLYYSLNNGGNWTLINEFDSINIYAIESKDSNIYALSDYGIHISQDNGLSWNFYTIGSNTPTKIAIKDSNIYVGTYNGIFKSSNNGISWIAANNGLNDLQIFFLRVINNNIFTGTNSGIYVSTNSGNDWISINSGLSYQLPSCINIFDTVLYVGTYGQGVWKRSLSNIQYPVSISQNRTSQDLLNIFPNPAQKELIIESNNYATIQQLEIINIIGQNVFSSSISGKTVLDISDFSSGIYFIHVSSAKTNIVKKFIKE